MKRARWVLIVALVLLVGVNLWQRRHRLLPSRDGKSWIAQRTRNDAGHYAVEIVSANHQLDRIYKSMQGPSRNQTGLRLLESSEPEKIWLTALETRVVDADDLQPLSEEFLCHANLAHGQDDRLFTLVPGRLDIRLPNGFGLPFRSDMGSICDAL